MRSRKRSKIAIIIEVKKRELPFLSILKETLSQKGFQVRLIPFRELCTWRLLLYRPDIVLINGLRHEYPNFVSQIFLPKKLFKAKIACYYSEQIGYYNESLAHTYNNNVILNNVDYHISWGPRFAKDLIGLGVPKEKMWYVGSLQYDIDKYSIESSESVKHRLSNSYGLPSERKWIVYADNLIKRVQPEGLYEIRRRDTIDMIKKVAVVNPDSLIVFRPHPETPPLEIKEAKDSFSEFDNVAVITDGHIFDWVNASSALIIWRSTSAIQAMFNKIPVFGYMTSDGKNLEMYWYRDIFPTFVDAELLAKAIKDVLGGASSVLDPCARKKEDFVKEWYFKKDGYTFDRICELLDTIDKKQGQPLTPGLSYSLPELLNVFFRELKRLAADLLKGRFKGRNITRSEVREELKKFDIGRFEDRQFDVHVSDNGYFFD